MIYGLFSDQPPGASGHLESSVPRGVAVNPETIRRYVMTNALVLTGLATFRVVGHPGIIVTPQGAHE